MNETELSGNELKGYLVARSFTRAIGDEIVSNITSGNNTIMNGPWTIEPYIMYKDRAAKFEQLVFIGKETVIL